MPKETLRVTEHAIIRYLERAMNLNIDVVREHIATICRGPAAVGAVCVRAEGVRFEIANGNTVTTVVPDRAQPSNNSRDRNQRHIERTERDRTENSNGIGTPHPLRSPSARAVYDPAVIRSYYLTDTISCGDPGPAGFDAFSDGTEVPSGG